MAKATDGTALFTCSIAHSGSILNPYMPAEAKKLFRPSLALQQKIIICR